jgi:hypothetical protein
MRSKEFCDCSDSDSDLIKASLNDDDSCQLKRLDRCSISVKWEDEERKSSCFVKYMLGYELIVENSIGSIVTCTRQMYSPETERKLDDSTHLHASMADEKSAQTVTP